jgi:cyclopropane fatty-acyl-phospholipid synthase-like methyltransferase
MSEQFYTSISKYYPHIFPLNPSQVRFLSNILPYNGARVMDVGCATGELAFALARFGFPTWGIDFDAEMIEMAQKEKSEDTIFPLFEQIDMRLLDQHYPDAFFDTIICFGNTIVHLLKDEDIHQFLTAVYRTLADDGTFTLQLLNYNHILQNTIKSLPLIDNEHITFERKYEYSESAELIDFNTRLTVKATGKVIENSVKLNPLRQERLEELLHQADFTNIQYFGNFEGEALLANSLPLILTCTKN